MEAGGGGGGGRGRYSGQCRRDLRVHHGQDRVTMTALRNVSTVCPSLEKVRCCVLLNLHHTFALVVVVRSRVD